MPAALLAKASAAHDISTNEGVSTQHTGPRYKGKAEYHLHAIIYFLGYYAITICIIISDIAVPLVPLDFM